VDDNDKEIITFIQRRLRGSRGEAIREALKRYARICGYKPKNKSDLEMQCQQCAKEHEVECPALEKG
jgi:ribosomal protein L44E